MGRGNFRWDGIYFTVTAKHKERKNILTKEKD